MMRYVILFKDPDPGIVITWVAENVLPIQYS